MVCGSHLGKALNYTTNPRPREARSLGLAPSPPRAGRAPRTTPSWLCDLGGSARLSEPRVPVCPPTLQASRPDGVHSSWDRGALPALTPGGSGRWGSQRWPRRGRLGACADVPGGGGRRTANRPRPTACQTRRSDVTGVPASFDLHDDLWWLDGETESRRSGVLGTECSTHPLVGSR